VIVANLKGCGAAFSGIPPSHVLRKCSFCRGCAASPLTLLPTAMECNCRAQMGVPYAPGHWDVCANAFLYVARIHIDSNFVKRLDLYS